MHIVSIKLPVLDMVYIIHVFLLDPDLHVMHIL